MNKYKASKVEIDGIKFDSKRESNRYLILKEQENKGEITNLQIHPLYELIPRQVINGKVVERKCSYEADFSYYRDNKLVVEDVKGVRTPEYIIKRKLMLYIHGIQVTEIK